MWPTCKHVLHLWQLFPPCEGPMQPAPQPTAKRRRLDDDEIGTQGMYCIIEITPSTML